MFNIPVILLKNLVILPNQEIKLELNNVISGKAINDASDKDVTKELSSGFNSKIYFDFKFNT